MAENNKVIQEGLFNRVYALLGILEKFPAAISDEALEGVIKVLPADTARSIGSLLKPSIREASIPFMQLILKWMKEAKQAKAEGKKVILLPFNFNPEIIHFFDNLFPVTSEVLTTLGVIALEGQGERYWDYAMGLGLPDHICSANTVEIGSVLTGVDFEPDAIISAAPGACDMNAKIHEFIAMHLNVPQFVIEKPPDNTHRGLQFFKKNYQRLVAELEEFAGEKLNEEKMREVAEKANRCTELYYDLWELKKQVPCPVPGLFSLFIIGVRFAMWGRDESVTVLQKMIEVSRRNMENPEYQAREEVARVLWTYVSYYYDLVNFYDWMDDNGIANMGDMLQINFTQPIDLTSKETILDGIVENAWNAFMTRQMGGDSMSLRWVDDLVYIIKELGVTGALFCGHHACKQSWSVSSIARNEVQKRTGVPTLNLQGDSWVRTMTPISVIQEEIEQFVNNVVNKRGRRRRARA